MTNYHPQSMKFGYLEFRYGKKSGAFDENFASQNSSINIGDNIQTLAVRNLFNRIGIPSAQVIGVDRDDLPNYCGESVMLLMNGCFYNRCFPLAENITPVFFGFNTASESVVIRNRSMFQAHQPIGCRDAATMELMTKHNILAYVSGCATLTLDRRDSEPVVAKTIISHGSGSGEFPGSLLEHIPASLLGNAAFIFQRSSAKTFPLDDAGLKRADKIARSYLEKYRMSASLVITPLLHVASPCLAMGIPVIIARKDLDARFTAINKLTPVHTPDNFGSINWQPETVELEPIKIVMENVVRQVIKGESAARTDIDFLSGVYDTENKPTGGPANPKGKSLKSRGKLYQFIHCHWLRK